MNRLLFAVFLLAGWSSRALGEEAPSVVMLRGAGGPVIEIRGLHGESHGRMVSPGWSLALSEGVPQISRISDSQALVVWSGPGGVAASIVKASGGKLREVWSDAFEAGWAIQPAGDFNRDGCGDFLLVESSGEGDDRSYRCAIAVWDREEGIDVVTDPEIVVPQCRGAYFAAGDLDGDGVSDVVFHSFAHGGTYETSLYVLKGRGDGTVEAEARKVLLLTSPHAATTPVLEDLDGDGDLDVFLPPDDDVGDEGQTHVAFNRGDGRMENLKPSVDLRPENEDSSSDEFSASAFLADTDQDGKLDLVTRCGLIASGAWEVRVHLGQGAGQFEETGRILASGEYARTPMPALAWIRWPGNDLPAAENAADPKVLETWWTALGSARPRVAARAMGSFLRAGPAAARFLADRVPPAAALDEQRVQSLVRDLDADDIEVREKATETLVEIADEAERSLRKALAETKSAEVEARLRRILESPPAEGVSDLKSDGIAQVRLLALLEALDTPETREAVARLVQPNVPRAVRRAARDAVRRQSR